MFEEVTLVRSSKRKCAGQMGQQGQGSEAGLCFLCLENECRPVWLQLGEQWEKWKERRVEGKPDPWDLGGHAPDVIKCVIKV